MSLKTKDIVGSGKYLDGPVVIPEEDTSIGVSGSARRMKSWDQIHEGLTQ